MRKQNEGKPNGYKEFWRGPIPNNQGEERERARRKMTCKADQIID